MFVGKMSADTVIFRTRKFFSDGSVEYRCSFGKRITPESTAHALQCLRDSRLMRAKHDREIRAKLYEFYKNGFDPYDPEDRSYLNSLRMSLIHIERRSLRRSVTRSRERFFDICRQNDFKYMVTWTFDKEKVDRLTDKAVMRAYTQFQNYLHKQFPFLYWVSTREYHKNGGLHFHLLLGGVTMEQLGCVRAKSPKGRLLFTKGKIKLPIYNVTKFRYGFSTLTEIRDKKACINYCAKYISKTEELYNFFGKKRFFYSRNCKLPIITKEVLPVGCAFARIDLDEMLVDYAKSDGSFIVFRGKPNVPLKEYSPYKNAESWKARFARLESGAYLTIAPLNRNTDTEVPKFAKTDEELCREWGLID